MHTVPLVLDDDRNVCIPEPIDIVFAVADADDARLAPRIPPQRLQHQQAVRAIARRRHQMVAACRPAAKTAAAKRVEHAASFGIGFADNANQLGVFTQFRELRFHVGRRAALAVHGDGLTDTRAMSRALNRVLAAPVTTSLFGRLHPDTAFALVQRILDPMLGEEEQNGERIEASARRQQQWAEARLAAEPELGLLLMAHTHRPRVHELPGSRHYLNPGAFFDGFRYAVVTETGAALHRFTP